MTNRVRPWLGIVVLTLACYALGGCPGDTNPPALSVEPSSLNLGATSTSDSFTIGNVGGGTLSWTVSIDIEGGGNWLTASPLSGSTTTETDRVTVTVDRTDLAPSPDQPYSATLTITSNGGSDEMNVYMTVPGAPLIEVSATSLSFTDDDETAELLLSNTGDELVTWVSDVTDPSDPEATVPFTVTPSSGTLSATSQATLEVKLDSSLLNDGTYQYTLLIDSDAGDREVTLDVEIGGGVGGDVLAVNTQTLDFGTEAYELTFELYNDGYIGTVLEFTIETDRQDLLSISPMSGTSEGRRSAVDGEVAGTLDVQTITVFADRTALVGTSDTATITIAAADGTEVEVTATVAQAPLIVEGALNRTRPPYLQRFVFLLRDSAGEAINTTLEEEMEKIRFFIIEDEMPLDLDETNYVVQGPENLKCNVVVMLDLSGSMYYAGVDDPVDPLAPGEAIESMFEGVAAFIDWLPAGYQVALMEHHDRQQTERLIHGFTTDKDALKTALQAFSVPVADHGASELYEALIDACIRLGDEDASLPPFDDADVQAIVFITDGRDTSSVSDASAVIAEAGNAEQGRRVRLYPVAFGESINTTDLTQLAQETGGHRYDGPSLDALEDLLGTSVKKGRIWTELERQIVLTYPTLFTDETHTYSIRVEYQMDQDTALSAYFEHDGLFALGDVRAGQITLRTSGISEDGVAEVFVRAEYVPRNTSFFRLRFIVPDTITLTTDNFDLLEDDAGLLAGWRMLEDDTCEGAFIFLTEEDNSVPYGSFGNLMKLTFEGLDPDVDRFDIGFRVDNAVYINPPFTKYFQYPNDFLNNTPGDGDFVLTVRSSSDTATIKIFAPPDNGYDIDNPDFWDRDLDTVPDFEDLLPDFNPDDPAN
ncbi:MAG TPA: VWA domain-containing protein [Candidatus Hydrogenedentes bacterium]|nr:VWA domain-containing protein [Candidatus Hydrogenedentota bacterium]